MEEDRRIGCGNSKLKLEADRRLNKLETKSINIRPSMNYTKRYLMRDELLTIMVAVHL